MASQSEKDRNEIAGVLQSLIDSGFLEISSTAGECLECFEFQDWEPMSSADKNRFNVLKEKGMEMDMSHQELNEFLGMVCEKETMPAHFYVLKGIKILERIETEKKAA